MSVAKQALQPKGLAKPKGVWSTVVKAKPGSLVFIAGLVATDEQGNVVGVGDIAAQTRQVCENLRTAVRAAGGELSDIMQVNVYARDVAPGAFAQIHAVRREFFPVDPPSSTMVEVTRLVDERYLIEINAIAVI
jgi:enamine deaminase RidA (YjgF/YER057c/UK114 family)